MEFSRREYWSGLPLSSPQDPVELTPKKKKDVIFIIQDWIAKLENPEIAGVMGKFAFGVQDEAGQRLTEFCQENTLVIANMFFQQCKT